METPIIEISQGKLAGTKNKDLDGHQFYSFKGIPYGQPPIKELRFKAPQPALPWSGIFQATKNGYASIQSNENYQSEDCLNLNIYTPQLPKSKENLLPVMVWIHGGSFTCGSNSSEIYGPEFLITGNIVLVSINYRLGILGFLNIQDSSVKIPGNAGFKDMVLALQWIQDNISSFGGNPKNVTIFGESAGGASVHSLLLSPLASGLFHKAIAQSGCMLNPWTRAKPADLQFYKAFNCEDKTGIELLNYLQNLPTKDIIQNQNKINYSLSVADKYYWGLTIEDEDKQAFLAQDPVDVIRSGNFTKVPFILGFNDLEGWVINSYKENRIVCLLNFENHIPHFLGFQPGSKESQVLAGEIQKFYGNNEISLQNRDLLYELVTDHSFKHGIVAAIRLHSVFHPVYFYQMSLNGSLKFLKFYSKLDIEKGAVHGDDVAYLFNISGITPTITHHSEEYKLIKKFVNLWIHFAYYGKPSLVWKSCKKNQISVLQIDRKLRLIDDVWNDRNLRFWDSVFRESNSCRNFINDE